jgi:hypothetical protein
MSKAVTEIVSHFKWEIFGLFFHTYTDQTKGYSSCHHILAPIHKSHNNGSNQLSRETFDHDYKYEELRNKLSILKEKSRSKFLGERKFSVNNLIYLRKRERKTLN